MVDVLNMVNPGVWMGSIDLNNAYYTIPVLERHQQFLTFAWDKAYYRFTCLPNGYAQAPYIFTKLLKQPFSKLRQLGFRSVIYIDDSFLLANTFQTCMENITQTIALLCSLGFTIHPDKSVLIPTQQL